MAMFGKSAANYTPQRDWSSVLSILGASLKDASPGSEGGNLLQVQGLLGARQQEGQKQAFLQQLQGKLGPQYAEGSPAPAVQRQGLFGGQAAAAMSDSSAAIGAATGGMAPGPAPEAPQPYQYQPPQRTSNGLNINSPELPQLALLAKENHVDLSTMIDVMKAQQSDMAQSTDGGFYDKHNPNLAGTRTANRANVNGTIADLNDPANTNRVISEAPVKGAMPVYDNLGRVTDWNLPAGAQAAIGQASQADKQGATMGTVFNRPNGDGTTTPTLGAGMFGADGPGRTQSPADAIRAEGAARGDTERAQAVQDRAATAGRQLSALDQMEKLLPDVISGFGADARLTGARALALTGNADAQRKVAATETFVNQGRVLVASIIKTFGANPTEGERKFAETMSGANAELNPETLKEGIRLQRARINRDLQDAGKARPAAASAKPAPPLASRAANTVYQTPKGPLKWTGTGWVRP